MQKGIDYWFNYVDASLISYAIEEAARHGGKWSYIEAIIKSHFKGGRLTREDAEKTKGDFRSDEKNNPKYEMFTNDYDYDELENRVWQKENEN